MKYIPLALVTLTAIGCAHNEFDISPAQVSHRKSAPMPSGADPARMGAEESKTKFKKGERLPDGTIADHEVNMVIRSDQKPDH